MTLLHWRTWLPISFIAFEMWVLSFFVSRKPCLSLAPFPHRTPHRDLPGVGTLLLPCFACTFIFFGVDAECYICIFDSMVFDPWDCCFIIDTFVTCVTHVQCLVRSCPLCELGACQGPYALSKRLCALKDLKVYLRHTYCECTERMYEGTALRNAESTIMLTQVF